MAHGSSQSWAALPGGALRTRPCDDGTQHVGCLFLHHPGWHHASAAPTRATCCATSVHARTTPVGTRSSPWDTGLDVESARWHGGASRTSTSDRKWDGPMGG